MGPCPDLTNLLVSMIGKYRVIHAYSFPSSPYFSLQLMEERVQLSRELELAQQQLWQNYSQLTHCLPKIPTSILVHQISCMMLALVIFLSPVRTFHWSLVELHFSCVCSFNCFAVYKTAVDQLLDFMWQDIKWLLPSEVMYSVGRP